MTDRAANRERECTCCPPGKRPAIEHAKGCPRRAPRTVPLSASSVGEQIAALTARPAPDDREA
ncbi:MAG TPA: hypothetical protein VFH56_02220 [Acidimicrobiales bacterium]|nr:hypothetical protein [Acidimicrobiales bacterium]